MPPAFFTIKMAKLATACLLPCLVALLLVCSPEGFGQTPPEAPPESKGQDQPDVLRVYTELVQTDVMVFDKQGHFVNGLKRENFELRIDGKLEPIDFFEKITAGSINEESQIAAARGSSTQTNTAGSAGPTPLDRGRPVFFYVDDLHLDITGLGTARKLITHFIDNEMGQNDEAAIASASGQIGFLQQLTDNKTVLRAALERLKLRPYSVRDFDRPAMTEYQGLLITNYDRDLTEWFVGETLRANPGMGREAAESMVTSRAHSLAQQAGQVTTNTLTGLEGLIRAANKLPGRKLLFFISGGFFLDDRNSDSLYRLQRITSAAARSGVVIYSMDARGLVTSLSDASSEGQFDPSGRVQRASSGELLASQDSLNALAVDTGGKAVFNTNSLEPGLGRILKETSTYYLLAWKPDHEAPKASKFRRIEVKVVGKPDLTVQVRRGFFDREPDSAKAAKPAKNEKTEKAKNETGQPQVKSPEVELHRAMMGTYPDRDIPVSISLSYLNTPTKGPMLSTAMQVPNEFFSFSPVNGRQTAVVAIAGVVFDDRGNAGAAFDNRITIDSPSLEAAKEGSDLTYGYPIYLKPGLYQVRVGVRDEKTGRTGTAQSWIEIPDSSQLALSSLLLGARMQPKVGDLSAISKDGPASVEVNITHDFSVNQYLRFLVFVYNAAPAPAPANSKPDVAIQVQIVRDGQPVVTTALRKVSTEGIADLARIPYAAEISLSGLPAGLYLLQVTVVDRVAKRSASQQTHLEIQ